MMMRQGRLGRVGREAVEADDNEEEEEAKQDLDVMYNPFELSVYVCVCVLLMFITIAAVFIVTGRRVFEVHCDGFVSEDDGVGGHGEGRRDDASVVCGASDGVHNSP